MVGRIELFSGVSYSTELPIRIVWFSAFQRKLGQALFCVYPWSSSFYAIIRGGSFFFYIYFLVVGFHHFLISSLRKTTYLSVLLFFLPSFLPYFLPSFLIPFLLFNCYRVFHHFVYGNISFLFPFSFLHLR
ncbi:hypothetical protein HOY82DRAFT_388062 [Tuber indicum]|nr:hypothetical protein HOY82DRAFT_388062 [Tuber indicum]